MLEFAKIKNSDSLIIFAVGIIVLILAVVAIIAINGKKNDFEALDMSVPLPPPMFLNAIAFASDPTGDTLKMDVTLKANCSETFDYIQKFIDVIPLSWAITAIKYAIQI